MPKKKIPAPKKTAWKTAKDVRRLTFSRNPEGKLVCIGGNLVGRIYIGRIYFRDKTSKRVAIKVFNDLFVLNDKEAERYRQTINGLRAAGVRLPKMDLMKIPTKRKPSGEWVQISQLFGSVEKKSKIVGKSWLVIHDANARKEALVELMKVANVGYKPALDLVEPFMDKSKGVIPIDIDSVVSAGKTDAKERAGTIFHAVRVLSEYGSITDHEEYQKLARVAFEHASPEMREALRKISSDFGK